MAKILVTGSLGQLGSELKDLSDSFSQHDWIWTDLEQLDITDESAIDLFLEKNQPKYIINTAAYTAVDKAESQKALCQKINALGPELLAKSIDRINARMIHISSDYVYDNQINRPLLETDITEPKSVYARTKLDGDIATLKFEKNLVIRSSWIYSSHGHNFVKTMMRLGSERKELSVVDDQIGTPTYARDLTKALISIIEGFESGNQENLKGIYHYSNEGVCSWYDFALAIMEEEKLDCKVKPISSSSYPTAARRPPFSVLNKAKIKSALNLEIPHWREALRECLSFMRSS